MERHESPLEVMMKGAAAGLVGTAAVTVALAQAPRLMQMLGVEQAQEQATNSGKEDEASEPTEKLAEKVAEGVFEQEIDEGTRQAVGQAIHWGYGAAWGALYGIVQGSVRLPTWLNGTILGGVIALVASTLVPSMRLTPPPSEQPTSQKGMMFAIQILYGWITALVFHFFSREG
ncbi:MAG: hypothetical protein QOH93_793 [Chloroflexia bacterium]|nr:hypothetical protein [Chloroflexia bacterium]